MADKTDDAVLPRYQQYAFTTHNCLSKGIRKVRGVVCHEGILDGDSVPGGDVMIDGVPVYLTLGKDCFRTIEKAREKAEQMRLAKIRTLQNSIARLKALSFD